MVHAFKNTLIPVVTLIGLDFGSYLNGSILTETIFGWDGIGRYAVEGIFQRDYPVIMGCVLPAGQGQAPARQASIQAGVPVSVGCMTINKVCGSGLKSVMLGAQAIMTGDAEIVVAGGQESMSNTPYYLEKARTGYGFGHSSLVDGMIKDRLWEVYND